MRFTVTGRNLLEAIFAMEILDARQHLPAERDYLAFQYSGLNMFGGYLRRDLASAGLPLEFKAALRDGGHRPVEQGWPVIRPYWEQAKHGSYGRALRITARDPWGLPDVDDSTIDALAKAVMADNTPGLYRRVCRIAAASASASRAWTRASSTRRRRCVWLGCGSTTIRRGFTASETGRAGRTGSKWGGTPEVGLLPGRNGAAGGDG